MHAVIPPTPPAPSEPSGASSQTPGRAPSPGEGSLLFHVALAFGLVPGVSASLALIGWSRLRAEPRWARRLVALAVLDVLVFVAVGIATVVTAAQVLPGSGAPGASGASALGPRPRIGVVVEDAPGGARVTSVAPGSPAEAAGIARDDVVTHVDARPIAGRDALIEAISSGAPGASRMISFRRGDETRTIPLVPVVGPFAPVPLDRARCADALPDRDRTLESLRSPETLLSLGAVATIVVGLFGWGRRKGLAPRESAKVLLPFVAVLFVGPTVGGLLAALACPALVSLDVRYETVEILVSEIVLTVLALALYAWQRGRGDALRDEGPRYGVLRTLGQSILYVAAWMPRALLLTTPLAALFFAGGAAEEAPVAELVRGASRTPLDAALTFVAAAVLAPVAEESLFRGVLAPHLARLTDAMSAVLLTAAIFGVLHVGGHGPLFVGPLFLGAILGWARLRSGGLAAPIALHVLLNGTAMTLALTLGLE